MGNDLYKNATKIGGNYWDIAIDHLLQELTYFNLANYKDAAINVALDMRDRETFNKLVGSDANG